jgi:hypothetical protein
LGLEEGREFEDKELGGIEDIALERDAEVVLLEDIVVL